MSALNGNSTNGVTLNGTNVGEVAPGQISSPAADAWSSPVTDDLEAERRRLEREIAEARELIARAEACSVERDVEVRAMLRAELLASKEAIAEMERNHEQDLAAIRESVRAEIEQIRAEHG
jgi:hypothetical protein